MTKKDKLTFLVSTRWKENYYAKGATWTNALSKLKYPTKKRKPIFKEDVTQVHLLKDGKKIKII
jgi:hypothetical protein